MANETKWTPGPWTVGTRYVDENDIFGPDGFSVASAHVNQSKERCPDGVHPSRQGPKCRREVNGERYEANVRLIAAAPDMYDALRSARIALAEAFASPPPHIKMALVHVEAAMARARGES
jgi:hypothetical protein